MTPPPPPPGAELEEPTAEQCEQYARKLALVSTELQRADSKAAALLASLALPLGILIVALPSHNPGPVTITLVVLGGLASGTAALLALQVLRPHLPDDTRGNWVYWAKCTPSQVHADLTTGHPAKHVIDLSQLTRTKFRRLRAAVDAAAIGFIALIAALVAVFV
ncbi:Pycsar system effector family protein [Kitasatospora sp. NPDC058048]|uniref:Pycsar system effector family protein n=1 Tax=Kitasatospora sp. NPDC058048 TaxID=3346313 RepID=UPI0036DC5BC9